MPDDNASESIEQHRAQQSPSSEAVNPPPPPDAPTSQPADSPSNREVQNEVKGIEDRVKRAERWMIGLTAVIAVFALGQVIVGYFQWRVMSGQLGEMKSSSGQTDRLIDKTGSLAENAGKQADSTKKLVDHMKDQADSIKTIAKQANVQSIATMRLAKSAQSQLIRLDAWIAEAHSLATSSRESLTAVRDNFIKEQAPVIWATPQEPELEPGKQAVWQVAYSNFGRSPALHLRICVHPDIGIQAFRTIAPTMPCQPTDYSSSQIVQPRERWSTSVVPPGDVQKTAAVSDNITSSADIDFIKAGDGRIAVAATFEYDDSSGHSYRTTFCSYRLRTGAMKYCETKEYNDIQQLK